MTFNTKRVVEFNHQRPLFLLSWNEFIQDKMSESCGSNDFSHADGEVSSKKRTHKELHLEEAESTKKMASTSGQQSRSKIRRVICNDYTEIILQEAAEFSKAYERTAMTQVISEYESIAIAKNIDEKHSKIIPYKQVESILRVFYLKFTTFCNTMRSHPNPVIKSKINFCPDDGSITPSTYQYQDISDDLRTEFETIISHYGLLKEIFSFTFQENFGPASGFKAQVGVVENSSTSSQCVTCIGMEDFVRVMDS